MNFRFVLPAALCAALVLPAPAQTDDPTPPPPKEEELALTLPTDEWYVPKNTLQFGYRVLNSGASVSFGNLGTVASIRDVAGNRATGDIARAYDTGLVAKDALRANETNADGTQSSTPGQRYQRYRTETDGSQTLLVDYIAYTPGQTRFWSYQTDGQVSGGRLALSSYSATSEGATTKKEEGVNGGVELSLTRAIGHVGKRVEWGITAGLALNNLSAKTSGTVRSTLNTFTDYFTLNGPTPTETRGGPTFDDMPLPGGSTNADGIETTTPLLNTPLDSTNSSVAGAATVQGNWKVKGAYFLMRIGPSFRTQISDRWGVSASLGFAGAFAGSRYSVVEQLIIPDVAEPIIDEPSSTESKFLTGYYADVNVDWFATERTGLFAGVAMQQLDGYDQSVAGRTAKIDFGSAVGIRGGISIKF